MTDVSSWPIYMFVGKWSWSFRCLCIKWTSVLWKTLLRFCSQMDSQIHLRHPCSCWTPEACYGGGKGLTMKHGGDSVMVRPKEASWREHWLIHRWSRNFVEDILSITKSKTLKQCWLKWLQQKIFEQNEKQFNKNKLKRIVNVYP